VFLDAVEIFFATITQNWVIDFNNGTKALAFHMVDHN
jgi:hypothetical protein